MTMSAGVEDSGTGMMSLVHLQRGGSSDRSWSSFQRRKGRALRGGEGWYSGRCDHCASERSSARLKSLVLRLGQSYAKRQGSARVSFFVNLTGRGRTATVIVGADVLCYSRENCVWIRVKYQICYSMSFGIFFTTTPFHSSLSLGRATGLALLPTDGKGMG